MVPEPPFFHFLPFIHFFIAFILFLKTRLFQNIKIQENGGSRFKIKVKVVRIINLIRKNARIHPRIGLEGVGVVQMVVGVAAALLPPKKEMVPDSPFFHFLPFIHFFIFTMCFFLGIMPRARSGCPP